MDLGQDERRYYFAGTDSEPKGERRLIDDNRWHEITLDVREIRTKYPEVQMLQGFHIGDLEVDGGTPVKPNHGLSIGAVLIGK